MVFPHRLPGYKCCCPGDPTLRITLLWAHVPTQQVWPNSPVPTQQEWLNRPGALRGLWSIRVQPMELWKYMDDALDNTDVTEKVKWGRERKVLFTWGLREGQA